MPIQNITPAINLLKMKVGNEGMDKPIPIENGSSKNAPSFADTISNAINSVDQAQKTADQNVKDIVIGKSDNIPKTMISMEKAQLSFQMMAQMRNKLVNTYQELSRMQI